MDCLLCQYNGVKDYCRCKVKGKTAIENIIIEHENYLKAYAMSHGRCKSFLEKAREIEAFIEAAISK